MEKKGVGALLEAARRLSDLPVWTLELVGDGTLRADLEQRAQGLPVTFHGPLGHSQLAEAVRRVLTDAGLRERLGKAATARSGDFSIESTGLRYRSLLHDAMRPR